MNTAPEAQRLDLIRCATQVVAAYTTNHKIDADELPALIDRIFTSLKKLRYDQEGPVSEELQPAVPIKRSITSDYIICLDDGKRFKSLKRHLRSLGMTPEQYREKWNLPPTYPMASPNYSARRSELAKKNGLGRVERVKKPTKVTRKRK